jgi:NADP-dependent 3-hydroxy acid dehydrogenase YdfG
VSRTSKPVDRPDRADFRHGEQEWLNVNAKGVIPAVILATLSALRPTIAGRQGGHAISIAGILGKASMANASVFCASKY